MIETIHTKIRKAEEDYQTGTTHISEHVPFSLKENVEKIDAYLNSKHVSGPTDSLGREKPFFNIVTAAVNVWYRATDIDRANIRIKAGSSSQHIPAILANVHSQAWMKKTGFGIFLNEWGRALARYGSAVCKFVEKDGELIPSVVPWNRLIVDAVDIENGPIIEKLYMTPAQLRKNEAFDQEIVESLIETAQKAREDMTGNRKDNIDQFIEVYEIHGEMELAHLTEEESDEKTYVQQVHICSFVKSKDANGKDTYADYTLYSGREKNPYIMTHLIKEDGRTMAIGAVEHLFEAQWMVNHSEKNIKDQLDLVSKVVYQSADPELQGQNLLTLDNGSFILHAPNTPLTQVNNGGHDIEALMNAKVEWKNQGMDATGTPDSIRGNTMPSGTAARQVEALQQESHSLFELMTENKALYIEEMWRRFVIPHILKKLDTKEEIAATLDDLNIRQIDSMYIPNEARRRWAKKAIKTVLDSNLEELPTPYDEGAATNEVLQELKPLGGQRFFKPDEMDEATWKEIFKDFTWEVEVEVTSENHDKQATLTTLSTVLRELANMGDVENARLVLAKILEETGTFSPLELSVATANPTPTPDTVAPQAP